jgi:hypothetical protein
VTTLTPEVATVLARSALVAAEQALTSAARNLREAERPGQMHRVVKLLGLLAREIRAIDKPVPPKGKKP